MAYESSERICETHRAVTAKHRAFCANVSTIYIYSTYQAQHIDEHIHVRKNCVFISLPHSGQKENKYNRNKPKQRQQQKKSSDKSVANGKTTKIKIK